MPRQLNPESSKDLKIFGRRLAEKRMAAGISKQDFAKKSGLSYKHYFNIESGVAYPSMPAYIGICRVLGIEIPLVG